jgi:hypothetical protein
MRKAFLSRNTNFFPSLLLDTHNLSKQGGKHAVFYVGVCGSNLPPRDCFF